MFSVPHGENQLVIDNEGYLYLYAYEGTETVMYQAADEGY